MSKEKKPQLPHLLISNTAITESYTTPSGPPIPPPALPKKDRKAHATKLISQLNALCPIEDKIIQQQKEFGTDIFPCGINYHIRNRYLYSD